MIVSDDPDAETAVEASSRLATYTTVSVQKLLLARAKEHFIQSSFQSRNLLQNRPLLDEKVVKGGDDITIMALALD